MKIAKIQKKMLSTPNAGEDVNNHLLPMGMQDGKPPRKLILFFTNLNSPTG